jgi:tetratricopeptide (TPR) repeat protein
MNRIEQLQQFLKESPEDSFLVHALALEYQKAGDELRARQYFEQNLSKAPGYVATYYHLGKLLERAGATEEAIRIYSLGMDQARAAGDQHALSELRSVYEDLIY